LPFGYVSLNPQTPESRLIGYKDAMGRYCSTPFRECYEHGGVFCIDEQDNAHPALLTTINSTLANGLGAFPDALVQRHKDFILVCTGNTAGRGGDLSFPERRAFDAAFTERFAFLHWPYDPALEWRLTMAANPSAETAEKWLAWVRAVRAFCAAEFPRLHVTPTAAFRGAELLQLVGLPDQGGWSLDDVAESVLFRGIDSETRAKVLAACPLPTAEQAAVEALVAEANG
jgi:MoxR-like ATPase